MTAPLIPIPRLDEAPETTVAVTPLDGTDWPSILQNIETVTTWGDTEVLVYSERVGACVLDRMTFRKVVPPDDGFECRLFDGTVEVRCVADAGGLRAWLVRESDGRPVLALRRRYYLIGLATENPGEFREARYPDVTFKYPVTGVLEDGRAWIEVVEYYKREPDWGSLASDEIRRELAEPLLVAHRFDAVGIGD
jgi:hypothetical protein